MIDKNMVEKNFSKGASTYDKNAEIQKYMSAGLLDITKSKKCEKILEIGCGTGIFTEKILNDIKFDKLFVLDISEEMLNICKNKFFNIKNIIYIKEDIEKFETAEKYDLIVSNAVFQWLNHFENTMQKISNMLSNKGIFVFSMFAEKTYFELKEITKEMNIDNFSQNFYTKEYIKNIIEKYYNIIDVQEEIVEEKYSNLKEFFKYIKNIGANSAKENRPFLGKNLYFKMEQLYREKYGYINGIRATNHLLYFKLEKK